MFLFYRKMADTSTNPTTDWTTEDADTWSPSLDTWTTNHEPPDWAFTLDPTTWRADGDYDIDIIIIMVY